MSVVDGSEGSFCASEDGEDAGVIILLSSDGLSGELAKQKTSS